MLKLMISDIKAMLKKPLLFLVMFIGLAVGTFAVIVYYVFGMNSQYLSKNWAGQNRVIEFSAGDVFKTSDYQNLLKLFADGSLPEIDYASVSSYDSDEYDIIGIYYNTENSALKSGEIVNLSHLGTNSATVSADIYDDISLGDTVKINGRKFNVVGVFNPGQYSPIVYDARRIPSGSSFLAGDDYSTEEQKISNRPNKAVIVPFDVFSDISVNGTYFHIAFKAPISDTQRKEIEQLLWNAVDGYNITDLGRYFDALENNSVAEFIIYCVAILAGLINIITLFSYFLKENKKQYIIYKMLGASPGRVFALCVSELALYTLFAFLVGVAGAIPFIEYTGFIKNPIPYGFVELLIIYLGLVGIQLIVSLKTISEILYGKITKPPKVKLSNEKLPSYKNMALIGYRYSSGNIFHTASVSLLSLIITFVLTFGFCFVYDSNKYSRYISANYDYAISAFSPIFEMEYIGENEDLEVKLNNLENIHGVGKISSSGFSYSDEDLALLEREIDNIIFLRSVNSDFVKYSAMPLYKGSWTDFLNYVYEDENATIPCIVPYGMRDRYPLGYEFVLNIESLGHDGSINTVSRNFVVSGIAHRDAMRPNYSYSDDGLPIIIKYQNPYIVSSEINESGYAILQEFYIPQIEVNFSYGLPTYFIYSDNYDSLGNWRNDLVKYGTVYSFSELCDNYILEYKEGGGSVYFMHASIAGVLLVLGIGGYSLMFFASMKRSYGVYYLCGMPWKKAIALTLAGNGLDILIPGVAGGFLGVFVVQRVRPFALDSIYLSALTGVGLVAIVFVVVSAIIAVMLAKHSVNHLLRSNE